MSWFTILFLTGALPPPDYEAALRQQAEEQTDLLLARQHYALALKHIENFRAHISDDARLTYENGLVLRFSGEPKEAIELLEKAIQLDPKLAEAWYDLGEAQLNVDEKEAAIHSFQQAAKLSVEHPNGWAAPFRLAEIAGHTNDIAAFEKWLEEAMRRGFSFVHTLQSSTQWKQFFVDPDLGDIMRRLITVYENDKFLDFWQTP